ncbi:MAG: TMEM165/GDT1 family protein [Deltaproteobacteria bacterium]|nr:TMEM165/GDT1 family protein [Deltaproteobacteria bacterium]
MWDWKFFFATFLTIFVAELGDKTQFATLAASSQAKSVWVVLAAVILGLSLAGTIGVVVGKTFAQFINPDVLRYVSATLFITLGIWIFFRGN